MNDTTQNLNPEPSPEPDPTRQAQPGPAAGPTPHTGAAPTPPADAGEHGQWRDPYRAPTAPRVPPAAYAPQSPTAPGTPYPGQAAADAGSYAGGQPAAGGAPYPGGQPAPGAASYATGSYPGAAFGVPSPAVATESHRGRGVRHRSATWVALAAVAVLAAGGGSLGTAALTGAFDSDSSTAQTADLSSLNGATTEGAPVVDSTSDDPDWEAVAAAVSASVVSIQVQTSNGSAEGSGVILDTAGHVLTNNHVVDGETAVQVTLTDGRVYDATVVGTDAATDLAVVQIENAPADLKPATLGDSSKVTVGEPVMAVGNPLGLDNTATTGIVSAIDRPVSTSSETSSQSVVTNAIQIDAAINPGNSGGPLFDATGRVIGITSSIATLSSGMSESGSIGIGFAIPVNLASNIATQLIENGSAQHAFLGVSLSDGSATVDGTKRLGATIESVTSGSPAETAGLKAGDVVLAIDGKAVAGSEALTGYVRAGSSGDKVTLTVARDGKALDVPVTLATRTESDAAGNGSNGSNGSGDGQGNGDGQTDPWSWMFGGR